MKVEIESDHFVVRFLDFSGPVLGSQTVGPGLAVNTVQFQEDVPWGVLAF